MPSRYDLSLFNGLGSTTFDHPDPSLGTVLSAPGPTPDQHIADLIVFPRPRRESTVHTFRPPYYHRNVTAELNLVLRGAAGGRYAQGVSFLTPSLVPHGPAATVAERVLGLSDQEADRVETIDDKGLWLQIETCAQLRGTRWSLDSANRVDDFGSPARGRSPRFDPDRPDPW